MENSHKLGLYVAYYLSRFNEVAYKNLGYGNMNETHNKVGEILSVNPHTIKNMRDQFDPIHGFRVGWYQEPLSPSRIHVVDALEELDEISIRAIVINILKGDILNNSYETEQLASIVSDKEPTYEIGKFILRGPTGKLAEDFFIQQFNNNKTPFTGKLIDCRDYGCGYDFRVEGSETVYIEVKGLAGGIGGILFTNKEWQIANDNGSQYYLCVIKNIESQPVLHIINNPAEKLNPNKNIHTVIQVSWSVSEKELNL